MKSSTNPELRTLIAPYRGRLLRVALLATAASLMELTLLGVFFCATRLGVQGRLEIKAIGVEWVSSPGVLAAIGGVLFLLGLIKFLMAMRVEGEIARLSSTALADMQTRSMEAHLDASLSSFWHSKGGEIQHHIIHLPNRAKEIIYYLPGLIASVIMIAVVSVFAAVLSWKLVLAAAIIGGIYGLFLQQIAHHVYIHACQVLNILGKKLSATSHEAIAGIRQIKMFHLEKQWTDEFKGVAMDFGREHARHTWWTLLPQKSLEMLFITLIAGGLVVFSIFPQSRSVLDLSAFLTFIFAMFRVIPYLVQAGRAYGKLTSALPSVREYFLHLQKLRRQSTGEGVLPFKQGEPVRVELEEVTFAYGKGPDVLRNVSLTLEPNSVTALVGLSGSGKSTLIDIVLGLIHPQSGRVLCNGVDVAGVRQQEWLKEASLSSQDTFLFHDTIEKNLAAADPGATREQILAACRLCGVAEFLETQPAGLDTIVGDRGLTLSGGQRQRLALARALLKRAGILILDEPTSALDSKIEEAVYQELWPALRKRTTLIVSHNLNVIQRADRIHVLLNGTVCQSGTHAELIASEGIYRDLFNVQFRPAASPVSAVREEAVV